MEVMERNKDGRSLPPAVYRKSLLCRKENPESKKKEEKNSHILSILLWSMQLDDWFRLLAGVFP